MKAKAVVVVAELFPCWAAFRGMVLFESEVVLASTCLSSLRKQLYYRYMYTTTFSSEQRLTISVADIVSTSFVIPYYDIALA